MGYYPVYLDLRDKSCLVVGGGTVAERKVKALLKAQAKVAVVSPKLTTGLKKLKTQKKVKHLNRSYRRGDLKGTFLVIGATNDPEVNLSIFKEAQKEKALVNIVDEPKHCNFIVPSVVRRGDLIISISTSGIAPALAKKIRKELEKAYGKEYGELLKIFKKMREKMKGRFSSRESRLIWGKLLNSNPLALIKRGKKRQLEERIEEWTS